MLKNLHLSLRAISFSSLRALHSAHSELVEESVLRTNSAKNLTPLPHQDCHGTACLAMTINTLREKLFAKSNC
jgi:hypothetical protein